MSNRPALWLRVSASDGACGWGEVFSNFPTVGAEHRARLVESIFVPLLAKTPCDSAEATRAMLEARTRRMAIQCGEPGPFAQIIGGIDQALWDMSARRAGQPLWKHLGGAGAKVRVYASGLGPDAVGDLALAKQREGFRAFKLKVGFSRERDAANVVELRDAVGAAATIMVDANQAWSPEQAAAEIDALTPFNLHWVEEPIAADESVQAWQQLAARTGAPLAAGENLRGQAAFAEAIDAGHLRFIQPRCRQVGRHQRVPCSGAARRPQSNRVLPPLARRRGRVGCVHASSRRARRRRLRGGGCQSQSVARRSVPAARRRRHGNIA